MAKKAELLEQAAKLKLKVTKENSIAEIEAAIAEVSKAEEIVETDVKKEATKVAKAGKRSAKAIEEVEEKLAKEERKAAKAETEAVDKPKQPVKPTRSKLERRGKKYREAAKNVEKGKLYSVKEAIELAQKSSPTKFDASLELHVNLEVDPRHADQNIRDNVVLPSGTGKTVKIAVFSDDSVNGADISGVETILKDLEKNIINFDILIATPANMAKLGKYARTLGPRGLMPNPKSGTVTTDVQKAVDQAKAGRVEYRVDSAGIVHVAAGKVSFTTAQLQDNVRALLDSIKANKPSSVKGTYVKSIYLTTTMGPSVMIAPGEL